MKVTIRAATYGDTRAVAENLRPEDLRELLTVAPGADPVQAVLAGWEKSETRLIGHIEGEPAFVIGVLEDGTVWLLGTQRVGGRAALSVLRACLTLAQTLLHVYPRLHNAVDLRNNLHVRWLKTMGFQFTEVVEVNGHPFQRFHMTREEDACAPPSR